MTLQDLILETIRDPASAARYLMGWNVPRRALYEGILAVAALNTLLGSAMYLAAPDDVLALPLFGTPFALFVVIAGTFVFMANLFYWGGRAMGGTGEVNDLLMLIIWLQGMRVLAQLVIVTMSFIAPGIAALMGIGVFFYGLYILIQFLKEAHGFESAMQSIGLLIGVAAGLMIGMMFLLTLAGVSVEGLA